MQATALKLKTNNNYYVDNKSYQCISKETNPFHIMTKLTHCTFHVTAIDLVGILKIYVRLSLADTQLSVTVSIVAFPIQVTVVLRLDSAIHLVNRYPVDEL